MMSYEKSYNLGYSLDFTYILTLYSIFIILHKDKGNKIEIKMFVSILFFFFSLNFFFMFEDVSSNNISSNKQCVIVLLSNVT